MVYARGAHSSLTSCGTTADRDPSACGTHTTISPRGTIRAGANARTVPQRYTGTFDPRNSRAPYRGTGFPTEGHRPDRATIDLPSDPASTAAPVLLQERHPDLEKFIGENGQQDRHRSAGCRTGSAHAVRDQQGHDQRDGAYPDRPCFGQFARVLRTSLAHQFQGLQFGARGRWHRRVLFQHCDRLPPIPPDRADGCLRDHGGDRPVSLCFLP